MFEYLKVRELKRVLSVMLVGLCAGSGVIHLSSASAADLEIASIRLGNHNDYTRFVIDMSTDVKPRVFTLADP